MPEKPPPPPRPPPPREQPPAAPACASCGKPLGSNWGLFWLGFVAAGLVNVAIQAALHLRIHWVP